MPMNQPIDWDNLNLDQTALPNFLDFGQNNYNPLSYGGNRIPNTQMNLPTAPGNLNTFFPPRMGVDASGNLVEKAGMDFGWNAPSLQLGLSGLSTLGNLWGSYQGNKIAKDSLNWQKTFGNANLNNSIRAFNQTLQSKAERLGQTRGWNDQDVAEYIKKFEATR